MQCLYSQPSFSLLFTCRFNTIDVIQCTSSFFTKEIGASFLRLWESIFLKWEPFDFLHSRFRTLHALQANRTLIVSLSKLNASPRMCLRLFKMPLSYPRDPRNALEPKFKSCDVSMKTEMSEIGVSLFGLRRRGKSRVPESRQPFLKAEPQEPLLLYV